MSAGSLLVGDIGGTNARFALADAEAARYTQVRELKCGDFESADAAIRHYLETVAAGKPDAICLAAAGPIVDGRVRFTNNPWVISAALLRETFEGCPVTLLNDFEAIAYSVPLLAADDCMTIGLPLPAPLGDEYTVGIVGPGTGLGAVGLVRRGETLLPVPGEASHAGFAPESSVQIRILEVLRDRFDRVSTERLVSGPGIGNLYFALAEIHGENRSVPPAADIFAAATGRENPIATEAVELFFELLGQFAGDYALALGAEDGLYIAGGIVRRYPDMITSSGFRAGFENKGRHRSLMERIPTRLILHEQPGLLGASYCAASSLRGVAVMPTR